MKRKPHHKKTVHHRMNGKKMGATSTGSMLTTFAGALGGFVAGNIVGSKLFPTMDAKIKGAIVASAGIYLLPKFLGKGPIISGLALGMGVAGGSQILKSLGVVSGIGQMTNFLPAMGSPLYTGISSTGVNQLVNGPGMSSNRGQSNLGVNSMVNGRMNTRQAAMMAY
jgi:hypothetical protein